MIIAALCSSFMIGVFFFLFGWMMSPYDSVIVWNLIMMIIAFLFSLIVIICVGIPITMILKKFNVLNWYSMLASGFLVMFIPMMILAALRYDPHYNFLNEIKSSSITGLIGLVASAIYYWVLTYRQNNNI